MIINPGIYYDMPSKQYFSAQGLSNSGLKDLSISPHHYKSYKRVKKEPTSSMIFGSAMHLIILESNRFDDMVFEHSYKTSKMNAEGQIFLHRDIIAELKNISSMVKNDPIMSGLLNDTRKEVSLFWKDTDLDIMCKARLDALNLEHNLIIDLKYCRDASYKGFSKQAGNLKYHWQAYWYLRGATQVLKRNLDFVFICRFSIS